MKLAQLRLRNFRCYKEEVPIDFDNLTAFVGKNDVGKSSIMDALDIFLNDELPDKHDASKDGDGKDLTIICEFSGLPFEVVLDENHPTTLGGEHLLNQAGRLEVHRTYSGHTIAPKCTSTSIFAVHPTAKGVSDLLQLKNAELKKRAKELGVDCSQIDEKVNAHLRQRIREHVGDLVLQPIHISLTENNGKKIWDAIKTYLPAFALFRSDRPSSDQDPEAQDPLKSAVREALKQKEQELKAITEYVEGEVRKVAQKTRDKLREMDASLANELHPQFSTLNWATLFKASITGDDDIPINKRGTGVRRLVLLNFFRAKAELQAVEKPLGNVIYAIEEPETGQHPNNQRLLVRAFTDLAASNQVILTTHTPMLARSLPTESLRYIRQKDEKCREVVKCSADTAELFSKALGVLPDNSVKLFIGVEGKHDISFLTHMSRLLRKQGADVLDLEKMEADGELIFFPLSGSNLALWTSKLAKLNRPEFHLYDRDNPPPQPAKYQDSADEISKREGCRAYITGKKEMENYLHFEAINAAYRSNGIELGLAKGFDDFDDVPTEVAKRAYIAAATDKAWEDLDEEKRQSKISRAKHTLNSTAASLMTVELLKETDDKGEINTWFAEMRALIV